MEPAIHSRMVMARALIRQRSDGVGDHRRRVGLCRLVVVAEGIHRLELRVLPNPHAGEPVQGVGIRKRCGFERDVVPRSVVQPRQHVVAVRTVLVRNDVQRADSNGSTQTREQTAAVEWAARLVVGNDAMSAGALDSTIVLPNPIGPILG